jgi:hypothetical protein
MDIKNEFRMHVAYLANTWKMEEVPVAEIPDDRKWWQFWKVDSDRKKNLESISRYMLEALDDFVQIMLKNNGVEEHDVLRTLVIDSIESLYGDVVVLPWWVRPMASQIKVIIINVICGVTADF